jgi:hypothetical protein
MFFSFNSTRGQNAIIGDGFANGWDYNNESDWVFFSDGIGNSRILITQANGTGNQYFRLKRGWGTDDYRKTEFRPLSGTDTEITLFGNVISPLTGTAGAFYISVSNQNNYYVFKTPEGGGDNTNAKFLVFELDSEPVSINSTYRIPNTVYAWQKPVVYAVLADDLPSGQGVYIRYSDDNWSTSSIAGMTFLSEKTFYYELSPKESGTINYYFFTSGSNLTINTPDSDFYSINLLNNGGSNYGYTVQSGTVRFSNTSGNWSQTSTWENGNKPGISDEVVVQNNVTIDENVTVKSILVNLGSS